MTTTAQWSDVGTALLGSWPNQIAAWGAEGIQAYLNELAARDVDPDRALVAIRRCPAGQKFPPSAPELAALGRTDPSIPTFAEMLVLLNGRGGVLHARVRSFKSSWESGERDRLDREAMMRRAYVAHPLVASFVERQGLGRLLSLNLDDEQFGEPRRRALQIAWEQHVEVTEDRDTAAIAAGGRRGQLGRFDPLAAIGAPTQIGDGR
jgi:hypothetical protein